MITYIIARVSKTETLYWYPHINGAPSWKPELEGARVYEKGHNDIRRLNLYEVLMEADYDSEGIVRRVDGQA